MKYIIILYIENMNIFNIDRFFSWFLNFQDKLRWFNSYFIQNEYRLYWRWISRWMKYLLYQRWDDPKSKFSIIYFDHLFNHSSNYEKTIIYPGFIKWNQKKIKLIYYFILYIIDIIIIILIYIYIIICMHIISIHNSFCYNIFNIINLTIIFLFIIS